MSPDAPPREPGPVAHRGRSWERIPVETHLIHIKEPLEPVLDTYVRPRLRPGDWLAMSEKVVAISEGRVVHESVIRAGWLAKLIVKGVKKYDDDVGYSDPRKMQVAIMAAGWGRSAVAMAIGGVTRLFGRHGDFYRIAGHRISEIDGFNPETVAPFDEFAMLGPADPDAACAAYSAHLGHPVVIIDGNYINVEVLGMSSGMPVDATGAREILLDNPIGQGERLTPFVIVHPMSP